MKETVETIASKYLGQKGGEGYKQTYDRSLLVRIPRSLNRKEIMFESIPYVGVDTWNAYEVSALTEKGQPVVGILKLVIPARSEYHVESKALKLYLNSYNMTKIGTTAKECIIALEARIKRDLDELLETETTVSIYTSEDDVDLYCFSSSTYRDLSELTNLDTVDFNTVKVGEEKIECTTVDVSEKFQVKSNLLRSNCRVTHQPDWGDVYIYLEGVHIPTIESLAKYIVSHRTVSHFHEEICEMIYKEIYTKCKPEKLMVACLYTRRGGIDINPIRASHNSLVPMFFTEPSMGIKKTLRQ